MNRLVPSDRSPAASNCADKMALAEPVAGSSGIPAAGANIRALNEVEARSPPRALDGDEARRLFKPDLGFEAAAWLVIHLGQENCAAERRMTGKRHLAVGKEDAHLGGIGGTFRRLHEDRFRQIELAGDRLHLP